MATIYKCDRCGLESIKRYDITKIEVETESDGFNSSVTINTEICKCCFYSLKDFLNPLPKNEETK